MKTLLRILLVVCAATFLTGIIHTAVAFAQKDEPSASGFGERRDNGAGLRETLAFNAVQHTDGTVTGEAEYRFVRDDPVFGENFRANVEIRCLRIDPDGRTATMIGVVKNASDANADGATSFFRVRDNGEGNRNEADGFRVIIGTRPNIDCNVLTGLQPLPITAGNIQVRP
jgi:hypothetical protein